MRQASEDAVLNANYVRASLSDLMSLPFGDRPCMHEVLFDDQWLEGTGVTTLDFAKAMIDEGFHPMTVYFPLVVHGAMLIEPTESESKASLDQFIASLRGLAEAAKAGDAARFKDAPRFAPRRRLDETKAAREPRLQVAARARSQGGGRVGFVIPALVAGIQLSANAGASGWTDPGDKLRDDNLVGPNHGPGAELPGMGVLVDGVWHDQVVRHARHRRPLRARASELPQLDHAGRRARADGRGRLQGRARPLSPLRVARLSRGPIARSSFAPSRGSRA